MRWFEQDTSSARCIIIQFHRPAKLKLRRMDRSAWFPCVLPNMRFFYFSGNCPAGTVLQRRETALRELYCSGEKLPRGNCIAAERNCSAGIALGRGKTPCISAGGQDALDEKIRKSEVKKMDAGSNGAGSNGRSRNYWNKERMAAGFLRHFSLIL